MRYVGLTVAIFASKNYEVIGYDLNEKLVKQLNSGHSHVEGLSRELLNRALAEGSYRASSEPRDIDGSEVVVIAVPTPLTIHRRPDLSYIESACDFMQG